MVTLRFLCLCGCIAVRGFCFRYAVLRVLSRYLHEGTLRRLRNQEVTAVGVDPHLLRDGFVRGVRPVGNNHNVGFSVAQ